MSSPRAGWSAKFPVYQIDFTAIASGKRVASTKRRIRWRFGFPSAQALDRGLTGTDCRGEEHDVTIVWSVTSGKRQITMDGREVHFSTSRSGMLDFSWTARGDHVIKVIAHAAPPLSATPGFRQYDLLIDGQGFFSMPKVYELGIKGPNAAHTRAPARYPGGPEFSTVPSNPTSPTSVGSGNMGRGRQENVSSPSTQEQEDIELKRAIQASIEESRRHLESRSGDDRSAYTSPSPQAINSGGEDLLNLGGGPPQPNPSNNSAYGGGGGQSVYSAPPTYNNESQAHVQAPAYTPAPYQSPPALQYANPVASPQGGALVPAQAPPGYYGAPPAPSPQYANQPASSPQYANQPASSPQYANRPASSPQYANQPPRPAPAPGPMYAQAPAPNYLNTPVQQSNDVFGFNSTSEEDPFAPKPPPQKTRNDVANSIMAAYTSPSNSVPTTPAGQAPSNQFSSSPDSQLSPQQNRQSPQYHGDYQQSMQALTNTNEEKEPHDAVSAAMKKLINFDRIDEPAVDMRLTMMQKEEKKKSPQGKSRGLPPVASGQIAPNASLSDIKRVRPETPKVVEDGKVMRAPPAQNFQQPGAVNGGALVVHGQGPPPLQQGRGFGLGAQLANGGFSQPQMQPPMGHQQGYQQPQMSYQQQPQYR